MIYVTVDLLCTTGRELVAVAGAIPGLKAGQWSRNITNLEKL